MAYIGVARPVIARYVEREGEISYLDGFRFGKAIKVSVSPNYEDVSDYGGINDTEEEQEFSYAEIALNTNEIPLEAEHIMFGHTSYGDEVIAKVGDRGECVGVGIRVAEVISGRRRYTAIWIHKVRFHDGEQNHESKGDSIEYSTPETKGKAVPDYRGEWRTKKQFQTKEEADHWLDEIAGIIGGNEEWHM